MSQANGLPASLPLPDGFVPPELPDPPVRPKHAATVMLIRDAGEHGGAPGHIEVFLQKRVAGMAFAGGMTVFPGGAVDIRDSDADVAWTGPSAEEWARWFECPPTLARALVCAAVRETFEESGVLFAGPSPRTLVADTSRYHGAREALITREVSLAGFLAEEGLVLRADLLRPWSSWVTPPQEPRRYDTRFFLAALPEGQLADGATTEAETSWWARPQDALDDVEAGETLLMPPTMVTLRELAEFGKVGDALSAQRSIPRIAPNIVRGAAGARVVFEEDA